MFAWLHHTSHDGGTMYIMDNMLHYSYMIEPWPNVMCALGSWSGLWTGLQASLDILFIHA